MAGTDSAEGALAAGFLLGKVEEIAGHVHHAGIFVHYHHAAGAHHRSRLSQRIKVDWRVEEAFWETAAGGASDLHRLKGLLVGDSAAYVENERPETCSHGNLYKSGVPDVSDHRKNRGTGTARGADGSKPRSTLLDNRGQRRQCLDVVHHGRSTPQALFHRIRRSVLWHSTPSFDRADKGGLFAANES